MICFCRAVQNSAFFHPCYKTAHTRIWPRCCNVTLETVSYHTSNKNEKIEKISTCQCDWADFAG